MTSKPLLPFGELVLERMVRAVEKVRDRLLRATGALEAVAVPYAVVGGHAVAVWVARIDKGAVRNTPEIDLLIGRNSLDAARAALWGIGFIPDRSVDDVRFLDGPEAGPRDAVRLLLSGEKVRPDYLLPAPALSESESSEHFRVLKLEALVGMKLTSFRDQDRVHIRDMIDVGLIDASWATRYPPELANRLQELLDDPNG